MSGIVWAFIHCRCLPFTTPSLVWACFCMAAFSVTLFVIRKYETLVSNKKKHEKKNIKKNSHKGPNNVSLTSFGPFFVVVAFLDPCSLPILIIIIAEPKTLSISVIAVEGGGCVAKVWLGMLWHDGSYPWTHENPYLWVSHDTPRLPMLIPTYCREI